MQDRAFWKSGLCAVCSLLVIAMLCVSVAGSPVLARQTATLLTGGQEEKAAAKLQWGTGGYMPPTFVLNQLKPQITQVKPQKRKKVAVAPKTAPAPKSAAALLAVVNQEDIHLNQRILADAILRLLPSNCKNDLQNFYVRYDNPERRGLGGKSTIILDGNVPDTEFLGLLTHECGHILHSNLPGTQASGESAYRDGSQAFYNDSPIVAFFRISWSTEKTKRKGTNAKDFVSGYASSDAFEDIAETYAFYILHKQAFAERAAENDAMRQKLEWMETYFPVSIASAQSQYEWNGSVPWDITRLPFTWNGAAASKEVAAK